MTIRLHPLSRARVRSGTPAEGLVEYAWGHRWPRRPAGTGDAICPASVANSRSHSAYCSACHAWRSSTYGSRTVCSAVAACASAARTQPCSTESVHAAGDGGYIRTLRTGASVTPGYSGIFWDILGYPHVGGKALEKAPFTVAIHSHKTWRQWPRRHRRRRDCASTRTVRARIR